MLLLFVRGKPWVKRRSEWDVTMGSFDGAEVCELTGLFMLDQLKQTNLDLGLYRDDGLGVTNLQGRPLEAKRQQIQQIFRQHDLRVTIFSNLEATDFLDIFLDLRSESYRVFTKVMRSKGSYLDFLVRSACFWANSAVNIYSLFKIYFCDL